MEGDQRKGYDNQMLYGVPVVGTKIVYDRPPSQDQLIAYNP